MKRSNILILILLLLLTQIGLVFAQHDDQYKHHNRPTDSEYLKRINAQYDSAWAAWQIEFFGLEISTGLTIGEVGAGDGTLAVLMAQQVGPDGVVYANEIDNKKIDKIKHLLKEKKSKNIKTILGEENDPLFPENEIELAIMVEVYHHLSDPSKFLQATFSRIKPGARLIIVEPDINQEGGDPDGCYSDPEVARQIAEKAGFQFVSCSWRTIVGCKFYVLSMKKQ